MMGPDWRILPVADSVFGQGRDTQGGSAVAKRVNHVDRSNPYTLRLSGMKVTVRRFLPAPSPRTFATLLVARRGSPVDACHAIFSNVSASEMSLSVSPPVSWVVKRTSMRL